MTTDEASGALSATLARLGMAETMLGADVHATIARTHAGDARANETLPVLAFDRDSGTSSGSADLSLRAILGRGGMGVVHLAEQRSLRRDVAIKTSVPLGHAGAQRALIREARTMGGLEHPNVVPVHALGREGDEPILVMKRVEGVSWRKLLDDPSHDAWAPLLAGHGDRMRANVEILIQVARALAFAHSRGVIHRDLKPDNVMIGSFGEVYLLDWGLALRLDERDTEPDAIVGTPGYIAPEMTHGEARRIDARTDVYLLGATLYELLTGRLPHEAATPVAALMAALRGELAPIPADAPVDLADLVRSALALDPASRPASAEAFRTELTRHLASHEADVLVAAADTAMERANAAIACDGTTSLPSYRALLEARAALTSAFALRPDHSPTVSRLDICMTRLVEREIALRSPVAARDLLSEVRAPAQDLVGRLEALERDLVTERRAAAAARRTEAEADISSAWRVIGGMTIVGALTSIPIALLAPPGMGTPVETLRVNAGLLAVLLAAVGLARRRLLATPASRRLSAFMVIWGTYSLPLSLVAMSLGDAHYDIAVAFVTGGLLAAVGAITLLPRLWPAVPLHAVAVAMGVLWPRHQASFASGLTLLNMLVVVLALRQRASALAAGSDPDRAAAS